MIIYTDVVCDLFHSGHVLLFKNIKNKYPDSQLYVGLMSDNDCKIYKREPVYNIEDRLIIIQSIKYVDSVIKNATMPITDEFIKKYDINLVIRGNDISKESENYWYEIPIKNNIYEKMLYTSHISTSKIIDKIKSKY